MVLITINDSNPAAVTFTATGYAPGVTDASHLFAQSLGFAGFFGANPTSGTFPGIAQAVRWQFMMELPGKPITTPPATVAPAQKYDIETIPRILIVDAKGNVLKDGSYMDADEMVSFLSEPVQAAH